MKVDREGITDIKIAYIGSGSCGWAWRLMADLALEKQLSGEVRLYDIDFKAAKNNEIIGFFKRSAGKYKTKAGRGVI